jgi:hypothetical protein
MRSVIAAVPRHRYDIQLCKMLELHKKLVTRMQQDRSLLPATWANQLSGAYNDREYALVEATTPRSCTKVCCLPDEIIYDILARYQGLRVLENLWLERQLKSSDFFSADESSDGIALIVARGFQAVVYHDEMYRNGELPARRRTTLEMNEYRALKADQRSRFHSVVTFVWLVNGIIERRTCTHLNLIARLSFHQTTVTVAPNIRIPVNANNAYKMRDHAAEYFLEKVLVAFDVRANPDPRLRDVKECSKEKWDNALWGVWWWAEGGA